MYTYYETTSDWENNFRKWEQQIAYERGIVKSVPPMRIAVSATEPVFENRGDPG